MKKISAIIIMICLIFSLCVPSFASKTDEAYAGILELVKPRIPDTDLFEEFDSTSYKNGEKTVYNFSWYNSDSEDNFRSMQVTVTENGFITMYHYNDSSKAVYVSKPSLRKIDNDKAMKNAFALIEKLNPVLDGNFILYPQGTSDLISKNYRFIIQRTENGIPVYNDTGYVTLSEDADMILSFNMKYTEGLAFPDYTNAISKETAENAFAEKIGMTILYEMDYSGNESVPYVAYRVDGGREYIDALTGDVITPVGAKSEIYYTKNETAATDTALGAAKPALSEAEIKELANISELMTEDDAVSIIKNNEILGISKESVLAYVSLYSDGKDNYFYNMRFETENKERVNVTFGAKNGDIKSFNRSYSEYKDYKDKTADENLAKKYVEKLAHGYYKSDNSGEYRLERTESNTGFIFVRYINDIPFFNDAISIGISPETGVVLSYHFARTDAEFPYPDILLTESEACAKLFEQIDYDLFYYPACSEDGKEFCDIAHLVYILDESKNALIYADSGKLVYEKDAEVTGNYTDISGHWAESVIAELAKYGIGFSQDEFRPDDIIVQKDFVELLTSVIARNRPVVIGKNHDYDSAYYYAGNRSIIKDGEEAPDESVTREKAAIYMVRAIGLEVETIAQLEDIYRPLYSDVTENIGYISILTGMKIVSGFDGYFNPKKEITRAEAMVMIYNYLAN